MIRRLIVVSALWVTLVFGGTHAHAACFISYGDVNTDEKVNVADISCAALLGLWYYAGSPGEPMPGCSNAPYFADADCSGGCIDFTALPAPGAGSPITVNDIKLLILAVLELGLPPSIDANGDGCPDSCEPSVHTCDWVEPDPNDSGTGPCNGVEMPTGACNCAGQVDDACGVCGGDGSSCQPDGGGGTSGDSFALESPAIVGFVTDTEGNGLFGAQVTAAAQQTTTDSVGAFVLDKIEVGSDIDVFTQLDGYTMGHTRVSVGADQTVAVTISLLATEKKTLVVGVDDSTLETSEGLTLVLPGSGVVDADGQPVLNTPIVVEYAVLNTADDIAAAPGDMMAMSEGQVGGLESFGMVEVKLFGPGGDPLWLDGPAELSFPLSESNPYSNGQEIGLYSFSEDSEYWTQEGTGVVQDGVFHATVTHFSWWNADIPRENHCIQSQVHLPDGSPAAGARLESVGINYLGKATATANEDGDFCIYSKRDGEARITTSVVYGNVSYKGEATVSLPDVAATCDDGCITLPPVALQPLFAWDCSGVDDDTPCQHHNPCQIGTVCKGGVCESTAKPDGIQCDDRDDCTSLSICKEGLCVGSGSGAEEGDGCHWVTILPGSFTMGSIGPFANYDEIPAHAVTLTRAFALAATEVTQSQWQNLMGNNPSAFGGCTECPVEEVSWFEALAYCNALSEQGGYAPCFDSSGDVIGGATVYECEGYRLPTEAEWEYAYRAGTTTPLYCGDNASCVDSIGWHKSNSGDKPHPFGEKTANAWGLYDMGGNVWEWVWDRYGDDYYESSPPSDPTGPTVGSHRGNRGGGFHLSAGFLRAAFRGSDAPGSRGYNLGFRPARSLNP